MKDRQSAFSLIEALIYSALLALFLGAVVGFLTTVIGTADKLLERGEVYANRDFLERKLDWLVGQASVVTTPAASSTAPTLTLSGPDASVYPATFALDSGAITLSLAGNPALPLTNKRVQVSQFDVTHFTTAQASSSISVFIALSSALYSQFDASTTLWYVITR